MTDANASVASTMGTAGAQYAVDQRSSSPRIMMQRRLPSSPAGGPRGPLACASLFLALACAAFSCVAAKPGRAAAAPVPATPLECQLVLLEADAEQGPQLRFTLINRGARPLLVLGWGTPLEGWMQPFVRTLRDGVELSYQGPVLERGDPDAVEYLRMAPGEQRSETFSLAPAFEAAWPGHYRVEPQIVLRDVITRGAAPRGRDEHQALKPGCPTLEFRRG